MVIIQPQYYIIIFLTILIAKKTEFAMLSFETEPLQDILSFTNLLQCLAFDQKLV